ncbi:protoporphyrinogen oxidase HemJ [Endozoicomonas sp. SM1973]|uniref:Protoporphyrinogen IX oxidase n=1 Tax=Spartinivicinus marinus TaxID=2994442 RepID=A0A853I303_9GAMM|nr:protoporphyrinogen oxidase HemJ [Spartinivicinus marinus]MCX4028044.1 protoporphyrinogen oxidase HemJ [Spartinivicinus marinus]NYZ68330.1 protoporphyrinogen oxidase HemJ [Spartinivicinus marinus]
MLYLGIKAFHIIAMVCWFAGLFYLPRLFVYHAMAEDQASIDRFKIMERKLYRGITTPAMIATVLLGIWLLSFNFQGFMSVGWMHVKLTLVILLIVYHLTCGYFVKQFRDDKNQKNHVFFRFFNEAPVLLLIAIVLLVEMQPF